MNQTSTNYIMPKSSALVIYLSQHNIVLISLVRVTQTDQFLNQAAAWFLEITFMPSSMCACMCVYLCVHIPEAINN